MKPHIEHLPKKHFNPYLDGLMKAPRRYANSPVKQKQKAPFKVHEPAKVGRIGSSRDKIYMKSFQGMRTTETEPDQISSSQERIVVYQPLRVAPLDNKIQGTNINAR